MKTLLFGVLLATGAVAQTAPVFHVTKIQDHIRSKDEPSFSEPLHTRRYTGTIGKMTVTAEEAITLFSHGSHLTVGSDYAVTKFKPAPGGTLHVKEAPDKKGHQTEDWLTVLSVSE